MLSEANESITFLKHCGFGLSYNYPYLNINIQTLILLNNKLSFA